VRGSQGMTGVVVLAMAIPLVGALQGCTDLDETPTSTISPDNYYRTEAEVRAGLAGVYNVMRSAAIENYWYLNEATSDETITPTRGQDWFDNGRWLELKRQTWAPASAAGGENINGAWEDMFRGISRANVVLNALQPNQIANQAQIEAELRALRAFYYLRLVDLFGPVPIVTDVEIKARAQNTRAEVFQFIETELIAARPALPARQDAANYGRLAQGAVDAMLATLYLNAEVFGGTVTEAGLTKGPARWGDAITVADRILNSGVYSLAADWKSNFVPNNESSPENIFVAVMIPQSGLGLTMINRSGHYNHYSSGGWNGFSTPAETYARFDAADRRREMFLVGPQVSLETGAPINDRAGNRLVLTPDIPDVTQATEAQGIRPMKFPFDPAHAAEHMGNDFPVYRLAEIYLIKAEALNELNRPAEAIPLINLVRQRVFTPPKPLATGLSQAQVRTAILNERLFELAGEGKRRTDMIRMGVYTSPFQFKATATEPWRILFPVPARQLQTNPLLVQNPGY
jgi:starch-binding outer membrane protein, SusD/RagB family